MTGFASRWARYVVEHCGLYYVADYDGTQYVVPLTHRSKRQTGTTETVCMTRNELPRAGGYVFKKLTRAHDCARKLYKEQVDEST